MVLGLDTSCGSSYPSLPLIPLLGFRLCHQTDGLGLHFEPNQYNVALKWWLGLDTSCGSSCAFCPDSILDPLGHHASTCKRGGEAVHCHNLLRDVFADSCRPAHLPVKLEVGNNLTPDHDHSRPADVLVHNWSLGKPAAFDFCVTYLSAKFTYPFGRGSVFRSGGSGLRDKKTQQ